MEEKINEACESCEFFNAQCERCSCEFDSECGQPALRVKA